MVYKFLDKKTGLGASVNQELAQELLLQKPYFPSPGIPCLPGFSFTNIHDSPDSRGRGRVSLFNSSLPLLPASQILRYIASSQTRARSLWFSSAIR